MAGRSRRTTASMALALLAAGCGTTVSGPAGAGGTQGLTTTGNGLSVPGTSTLTTAPGGSAPNGAGGFAPGASTGGAQPGGQSIGGTGGQIGGPGVGNPTLSGPGVTPHLRRLCRLGRTRRTDSEERGLRLALVDVERCAN